MLNKSLASVIILTLLLFQLSCKKDDVNRIVGIYTGNVIITLYGYNAGQDSVATFRDVFINVEQKANKYLILTFPEINNYIIDNVPARMGDFEYSKEIGRGLREDVKGNFSFNSMGILSKGFYYQTNKYYQAIQVTGIKN